MPERPVSSPLYRLAVAEIYKSMRIELVPRFRRTVPSVLFLQHFDRYKNTYRIESSPLELRTRERWPRIISRKVSETDALWWAVSLELRLREEPDPTDPHALHEVTDWLVIALCSPEARHAWWAQILRDETRTIVAIGDEQALPPGEVRDKVFGTVGHRFYPLEA